MSINIPITIKVQSKFLVFRVDPRSETYHVNIYNKKESLLGEAHFYKPWKKWIFTQAKEGVVFDSVCLTDITNLLIELDKEIKWLDPKIYISDSAKYKAKYLPIIDSLTKAYDSLYTTFEWHTEQSRQQVKYLILNQRHLEAFKDSTITYPVRHWADSINAIYSNAHRSSEGNKK